MGERERETVRGTGDTRLTRYGVNLNCENVNFAKRSAIPSFGKIYF